MIARLLVSMAGMTLLLALIIIGPTYYLTGDLFWSRGWRVIAMLVVVQTLGGFWLARTNPGLLRERLKIAPNDTADRFTTAILGILLLVWAVLIPLDVFRLHLVPRPPALVSTLCGAAIFFTGIALIAWVLQVNSFGATTVKIQPGHYVVDRGPYALVRHPMYTSFLLQLAGTALSLSSPALALAAIPLVVLGFLPRILIEEATLRRHLPGYEAYTKRVRWRLVPYLF